MNILIQITFLIFNKYPKVQFQSWMKNENKFTKSRFQDIYIPPHAFHPLTFWSFLDESWESELGIRVLESVRKGN